MMIVIWIILASTPR